MIQQFLTGKLDCPHIKIKSVKDEDLQNKIDFNLSRHCSKCNIIAEEFSSAKTFIHICQDCQSTVCSDIDIRNPAQLKNKCINEHYHSTKHTIFYNTTTREFFCMKCNDIIHSSKTKEFEESISNLRNFVQKRNFQETHDDKKLRPILYIQDDKMLQHNQFSLNEWCLCTEPKCNIGCAQGHDYERPGRIYNIHRYLLRHQDEFMLKNQLPMERTTVNQTQVHPTNTQLMTLEEDMDIFDHFDYIDPMCPGRPSVIEASKKNQKYMRNVQFNKYSEKDIQINRYTQQSIVSVSYLLEKTADELFGQSVNEKFLNTSRPLHAFCNIRPPGHHAGGVKEIHGFCFLNNEAYFINQLMKNQSQFKKICIVDWDIHHGDGIQKHFQDSQEVLQLSIHRQDQGDFFPHGDGGNNDKQGAGAGLGFNFNVTFNVPNGKQEKSRVPVGSREYILLFHHLLIPVIKEQDPDLILICCGFDACDGDPLGDFCVEPQCYEFMTKQLVNLQKPIVVMLEGGQNIKSLTSSAQGVVNALLADQFHVYTDKKWDYNKWQEKKMFLDSIDQLADLVFNSKFEKNTRNSWIDAEIVRNIQFFINNNHGWECLTQLQANLKQKLDVIEIKYNQENPNHVKNNTSNSKQNSKSNKNKSNVEEKNGKEQTDLLDQAQDDVIIIENEEDFNQFCSDPTEHKDGKIIQKSIYINNNNQGFQNNKSSNYISDGNNTINNQPFQSDQDLTDELIKKLGNNQINQSEFDNKHQNIQANTVNTTSYQNNRVNNNELMLKQINNTKPIYNLNNAEIIDLEDDDML